VPRLAGWSPRWTSAVSWSAAFWATRLLPVTVRSPDRGPRRPALATDSAQFRGCFRTLAEPTPLGGIMARLWLSPILVQRVHSKNCP
jgi:hypothetical protein